MNWWREADRPARRAFIAASLGWMLDSFDINLYALVLPSLRASLQISQQTSGTIQALMLLSAAAGGLVFGVIADRWGRTRALILSVLIYSVFTAASGLATTAIQLAVFRIFLGLGMGGEWASGAALVSETWPDRHRSKALGFMQSAWAIGFMLAAVVNWLIQDVAGLDWRSVFFVGVLPAVLTLWIRRSVPEPARWHAARAAPRVRLRDAMGGTMARTTVAIALMNACALFAYWGFNTWMPSFLQAHPDVGGIGLTNATMSAFVLVNNVGMWFGYVTFGLISDSVGRRRTYVSYLVLAAVFVLLYTSTKEPWALLALGPITSFFATGHFSGFGAVTAELYPTAVRATAQGLTYNVGRILSAAAPAIAGSVAQTSGYPAALSLAAGAYIAAALFWVFIPDTTGRGLQ